MSQLPKEQITKAMEAWGEWLGGVGPNLVDKGDMFKPGTKSVDQSGASDSNSGLSGYSIIDVANYDAALEVASGSPVIQNGGKVEVYEAFGL
ncbi:MAG: hypothetical protein V4611_02245 [Patescibacteria group bacterium]